MINNQNKSLDWFICPKCKKRDREISSYGGIMEIYCAPCNDRLAEQEKERMEFLYYHSED